MKTEIAPTQRVKDRLEKLRLYNYLCHKAVYPGSYGGVKGAETTEAGRHHYRRVDKRTQSLAKRLLAKLEGTCDTAVSWVPCKHDTYEVAKIVQQGREAVEEYLSVPLEVAGWGPLPVRHDCEGDQGWIYCPADMADQVARRIVVLEGGPNPEIYNYAEVHGAPLPPADLKVRTGFELAKLVKKGELKAPAMCFPEYTLPLRKISDKDALDQITSLVLNLSFDKASLLGKIEEIVLSTGRTA